MKAIRSFSTLILLMGAGILFFSQCNKEPAPEPNARFTFKDADPDKISVGQTVTLVFEEAPNRTVQHLVLFTGVPGEEYDSLLTDTRHSVEGQVVTGKEYEIVYEIEGTYKLTAVATSIGDWEEEHKTDTFIVTVTVADGRTTISSFGFDEWNAEGLIVEEENKIFVDVIEIAPIDSLVASFKTVSDSAEVYIGNTLQESGVTANDFTNDVTYTVKAPDGSSKDYVVKIETVDASSDNNLTFYFTKFPDAEKKENADTFTVRVPWGTDTTQLMEYKIHRNAEIIFVNDEKISSTIASIQNISSPSTIHVIAQNRDTATYVVKADYNPYPITSFMFKEVDATLEITPDHNNNTITYPVLYTVDRSSMVAYYESEAATVQVQLNDTTAVEQISGESVNDFTDTVTYNFIGNNSDTAQYDVIVNKYGP